MSKQAIEGKRINAFSVDPDELVIIGLDTGDTSFHPLYDERIKLPLSEALVLNIMMHGVLQPVNVAKDGDRVLVVSGRQRVRCAREANRRLKKSGCETVSVPVMVRRGSDSALLGAMVSENEIRQQDLIETKLPKLQKLLDLGKTDEECAILFGVTEQTIKNWLTLLESGAEVKDAIATGQLSASAGIQLASLPRAQQAEAVQEATTGGKATAAKAQRIVKAKKAGAKKGMKEVFTIIPPSKKVLRKLLQSDELPGLKMSAVDMLKWTLGEVSPERIKGLTAALKALE